MRDRLNAYSSRLTPFDEIIGICVFGAVLFAVVGLAAATDGFDAGVIRAFSISAVIAAISIGMLFVRRTRGSLDA